MVKHVYEEEEGGAGSRKVEVCSDESVIEEGINPLIGNEEVTTVQIQISRNFYEIADHLWQSQSLPVAKSITLLLQRSLPIRILTVGKKRSAGVQLIIDEYIEKLKHYCPVEDVRIKSNPKNARDVMAQIEHEDIAVMGLIKSNEWVVMLDERGLDVGSEQMASLIGDAGNTGASSILFCIGGPYGHGRQLRERADVSIKLSSLVLNHEVALVVLAEQLYRAWTILKGQKYHH
ncbi:hypothetical protein BUALT_Bualt10G0089000 [Buddleja alternifolia]|uniref:RNA methyltransferase n=1 Tax=Buddleja alternifolia TaxID=168488 RepID=A0AAV6X863_9LAMI|nr:hypothetical protein BUALT_Bualt10G0089000 [Buddleja alternifolia]